MNTLGNQTVFSSHANALVALVSLLSSHFNTRSFMVIAEDEKISSLVRFQKMTSKFNLPVVFGSGMHFNNLQMMENEAYLILGNVNSIFNISMVTTNQPKLIVFAFLSNNSSPTLPEFLSELTIPVTTSFLVVKVSEDPNGFHTTTTTTTKKSFLRVKGKCYRIYKPIPNVELKVFPTMYFGGENERQMKWYWETREIAWSIYDREIRDMRGINLTIALATYLNKDVAIQDYWRKKTSFFWRELKHHLGFRTEVHVEQLSQNSVNSVTNVYLKLLKTNADGLGILPAMSSERIKFLDFISTGLDSRYTLMVKNPEFLYSWQSVFKPLSYHAWMYMGVTILSMTVILKMIAWKWNYKHMDFSNCFLIIFGFVCCQGSTNIPTNISCRLICYTSLLFSFSIYQFYTSNFYSLLSTKEASLPFTSLEQFLAKRTHELYIHPDTAVYTYILKAKSGNFKRVWDEVLQKNPIHQLTTFNRKKAVPRVCKGKAAILGQPFQTTQMKELTCKLVPVNSGFFPTNIVTVVRKKFPFKPQFKFVHMRLLEGGISHKFKDQYLEGGKVGPKKTSVTNEPVSLEQVAFLFAISITSFVLSSFILGMEILTFKSITKKQRRILNASKHQTTSDFIP